MLFAYVDETSNRRHYRTVGLVVRETDVRALARGLDDVVVQAAADYVGVETWFELHGHDPFRASKQWTVLEPLVRARISIYRKALEVIAHHTAALYVEGVDRHLFRARYQEEERNEHMACLMHLLEKLDAQGVRSRQDVMVVADEHYTGLAAQETLQHARTSRVWGFRGRPRRIVDTVYFVPSHMSRLVQAADMVAFLFQRVHDTVEHDARAATINAQLWAILADVPVRDRLWEP